MGMHMYGELKRKPFTSINKPTLVEPPGQIIPTIQLNNNDNNSVMDLSTKGDQTPCQPLPSQPGITADKLMLSSSEHDTDSDTPSDSLLTGKPVYAQSINTGDDISSFPCVDESLRIKANKLQDLNMPVTSIENVSHADESNVKNARHADEPSSQSNMIYRDIAECTTIDHAANSPLLTVQTVTGIYMLNLTGINGSFAEESIVYPPVEGVNTFTSNDDNITSTEEPSVHPKVKMKNIHVSTLTESDNDITDEESATKTKANQIDDPYLDGHLSGALERLQYSTESVTDIVYRLLSDDTNLANGQCERQTTLTLTSHGHDYCKFSESENTKLDGTTESMSLINDVSVEISEIPDIVEISEKTDTSISSEALCEVDNDAHDLLQYPESDINIILGINSSDPLSVTGLDVSEAIGINNSASGNTLNSIHDNEYTTSLNSEIIEHLETELDEMRLEDRISLSNSYSDLQSTKILSNTETDTNNSMTCLVQGINIDSNSLCETVCGGQTTTYPGSESTENNCVIGINIDSSDSSSEFSGFTKNDILNLYSDEIVVSSPNTDSVNDSSSSSEFSGFTKNDILEQDPDEITVSSLSSDSLLDSSSTFDELLIVDYEDALCDSSSTQSYSLSGGSDNDDGIKDDTENADINVNICDSARPSQPPDKISPESEVIQPSTGSHVLRERNTDVLNLQKSARNITRKNYFEEATKDDTDDSDFEIKPKQRHRSQPGLREPSQSRINSQRMITESKCNETLGDFPIRAKDKYCPHCEESFYHFEGVRIHLEHAHKDIREVKGMNVNVVSSINTRAATGINNVVPIDTPFSKVVSDINTHDAMGKNGVTPNDNLSSKFVSGINTCDAMGKNGVTPIDNPSSNSAKPHTTTHSAVDVSPSTRKNNLNSTPSPAVPKKRSKPITNMTMTPNLADSHFHHKRRPKNHGKHFRPRPLDDQNKDSSQSSPNKKTKSEFVTVTHGIRRIKKVRKFKCKICHIAHESQAKANSHYRESHPLLNCNTCNKTFNNPNSLRRHSYQHASKKTYPCRNCNKVFPFESDLAGHRLVHRCNPGHMCNHDDNGKICGKWFFAQSDLNKHAKTHSGKIYSCYECAYTTIDIRYLRAHRYTHSDTERYQCKKCSKKFKHHTQLKRHNGTCM